MDCPPESNLHEECLRITKLFDADMNFGFSATTKFQVVGGSNPDIIALFSKPFHMDTKIGAFFRKLDIQMFAKGGLLSISDIRQLSTNLTKRTLVYMGDLDPPDLMNAALLMEAFCDKFLYGPYSSAFSRRLNDEMLMRMSMPMSELEIQSLPRVLPLVCGLESMIGKRLHELLLSKRKLEIDSMHLVLAEFEDWGLQSFDMKDRRKS